ncbi:MAG TPA: acyltransferase family protein, partial [Rhodopila sp.]
MTPGGIPVRRVGWLDGLRGIAALQVLLLHYASAFQPAIGLRLPTLMHNRWEAAFIHTPLFFPFDGYTAVYVFFLISGVVLTQAFERMPLAMATGILRRVVRLGLPMVAALAFGALLFALMPAANLAAAEQSGSRTWLGAGGPSEVSLLSLAHQAAFEGMFVGYGGVSLLPGWLGLLMGIVPHMRSFDVPLWTLHVEFYGSLIVLLLVALRAVASRRLYLTSCLALGLLWVP